MKLSIISILIVAISAIKIADPAESHEARAKNLVKGLEVIAA